MRLVIFACLTALMPCWGFAETLPSCFIGKIAELKDVDRLTVRSKRGSTYWAGNGSGVFVSSGGMVLTNYHVVDNAAEIVVVHDGNAYAMHVVKKNKESDLALLAFDGVPYDIPDVVDFDKFKVPTFPFVMTRESDVRVGEPIMAVGYPVVAVQGLEAKVTRGIVSSKTGFKGDRNNFQMDAAIFGGNSGGPVFDAGGALIGITVASCRLGENANYAIRMEVVKNFLGDAVKLLCRRANRNKKVGSQVEAMTKSTVLVLTYKAGARPHDVETRNVRVGNEARARTQKAVLHAQLLKVRKEWKELREITDGLIRSHCADDEVVRMNDLAREELGEQLIVYAEVEGADVKATIKPLCGIRDSFVQCEEVFALDGQGMKRGFPVRAELTYYTPQGALWKGTLDEIYDWRGTKEVRIKLQRVVVKGV